MKITRVVKCKEDKNGFLVKYTITICMVLKPVLKEFYVNGNNLQQKRHGEAVFVDPAGAGAARSRNFWPQPEP